MIPKTIKGVNHRLNLGASAPVHNVMLSGNQARPNRSVRRFVNALAIDVGLTTSIA